MLGLPFPALCHGRDLPWVDLERCGGEEDILAVWDKSASAWAGRRQFSTAMSRQWYFPLHNTDRRESEYYVVEG
jgi:hypothetical protein